MLIHPRSQLLRESRLLWPGQKPLDGVRVDQSAFSAPVDWCIFPERENGVPGTLSAPELAATTSTPDDTARAGNRFNVLSPCMYTAAGEGRQWSQTRSSVGTSESFTMLIHVIPTDISGSYHYMCTALSNLAPFAKHSSVSNQWGVYLDGSARGAGSTLSVNTEYVLIIRRDGATGAFFKNGTKESGTFSVSAAVGSTDWYIPSTTNGLGQYCFAVMFFRGALSDAECAHLCDEPYAGLVAA